MSLRTVDCERLPETLRRAFGFEPRPMQLEAIVALARDKKDLILIAKTSFGKSMIFQSLPVLTGGICLLLYPLNLLEEDQVRLALCNH
jgi:superfamily II DNA helicase RecQ